MSRFSSQKGNAIINVLIIFTLLTAGAALLYPLIIQNEDDQTRSYHQLQTVKLATTTMQAYLDNNGSILNSSLYNGSSPQKIQLADNSVVDLYAYKKEPNDFNVAAYYGDSNGNKQKDDGEKYFYKKILSTKSQPVNPQQSVKPKLSFQWDTGSMNACSNPEKIKLYLIIKTADKNSKLRFYQKTKSYPLTVTPVQIDETTYKVDVLQGLLHGNLQSLDLTFLVTAEGPFMSESEPSIINANNIYWALGYWHKDNSSYGGYAEYLDGGITIFLVDKLKDPVESEGMIEVFPCTQFVSAKDEIVIKAKTGLQLDEYASLTAEQNGQGRVLLSSSDGNVVLKRNSKIEGDANSNKSIIIDAAKGTILLEPNSYVLGAKETLFKANTIIAQAAYFQAKHSNDLLDLNANTFVYLDGMSLTYEEKKNGNSDKGVLNAETTINNPTNFCGTLAKGQIDKKSVFSSSCPPPPLVNK